MRMQCGERYIAGEVNRGLGVAHPEIKDFMQGNDKNNACKVLRSFECYSRVL